MKLIRFFLNILLFCFVFCISMLGSIAIYSVISYQSDDDYAVINFTLTEDDVNYADSVLYWYDDISTNVVKTTDLDTKLRVANWFNWGWWKDSMKYVDIYFVDPIVDIFKPVILPISSINEIKTYYDQDISDFAEYINRDTKSITDFTAMSATYFGVSVSFDDNLEQINQADLDACKDVIKLENLTGDKDQNGITDLFDVADGYNYYYQLLYNLHKYNQVDENDVPVYEKYFNKFIFEDEAGRHLKTSVYGLYVIELIALAFAIFFIWQNPIRLKKNDDGTTEIAPPLRGIHFKRKKKE